MGKSDCQSACSARDAVCVCVFVSLSIVLTLRIEICRSFVLFCRFKVFAWEILESCFFLFLVVPCYSQGATLQVTLGWHPVVCLWQVGRAARPPGGRGGGGGGGGGWGR